MGFITVITFCLGTSVADAPLHHCGWGEFSAIPWATETECDEHVNRLSTDPVVTARIFEVISSHPDYDGEWDVKYECVPKADWPAMREMIRRATQDIPV